MTIATRSSKVYDNTTTDARGDHRSRTHGAQTGEHALGGHKVAIHARDLERARRRVTKASLCCSRIGFTPRKQHRLSRGFRLVRRRRGTHP